MTDRPVNLNPSGPPETILDPEPAATESALEAALSRPTDEQRRAVADVVAANPGACRRGPSWVTGAVTTSSRTPTTASATTAGWTGSGPRAGGAAATCGGRTPPTGGSCGPSPGCEPWRRKSERSTRRSAAGTSWHSSTLTTSARSPERRSTRHGQIRTRSRSSRIRSFRARLPRSRDGQARSPLPHHRRGRHRRSRRTRRSDRGR